MAWIDLAEEHRNLVLNGEGKFLGVRGFFNHLERKKYKLHVRVFLSRYRGYSTCSELQRKPPPHGSAASQDSGQETCARSARSPSKML